ncbi:putative DNA-directed RNA polymerase II subunit RPB4 [Hypsibius exemplaris]|uniref:DNA-directed RNA polymerase II subunit RPB4 n=1 Tax=Hypsibius exemplaris TaxID=2072580 RepID=A0A1W0WKG4_HYPEX|nr:putative DNA-directed RNA polymerase II subunit RPB4 [Hypsibius exemplaris]
MADTPISNNAVPEELIEDAAELKFPKEFEESDSCKALFNSEVFLLLDNRKQQNEAAEDEGELPQVFLKTHSYTQRFSRFNNMDTIKAVRVSLDHKEVMAYEAACLANLLPETVEEVKALIPSMERYSAEELQDLLDDIKTKRSFQA